MRRRDISTALFGSVAATAFVASKASAQTCTPACYAQTAAEIAAGVTPTDLSYPPGNVRRYGADPSGTSPSTTAFQRARSVALAMSPTPFEIIFPAGTYSYATSPDWRVPNLTLRAEGRVVLAYTGAGSAWSFGNAGNGINIYNVTMIGDFIVDGGGCDVGVFCENLQHATIQCRVRNVGGTAFVINGSVLCRFQLTCSINEESAISFGDVPDYGVMVNASSIVSASTDNVFDLTMEGLELDGVVLNQCDSCTFLGTSEGNGQRGMLVDIGATGNLFLGMFMEANDIGDMTLGGSRNTFINCVASSRAPVSPYESVKSIHVVPAAARNLWLSGSFYAAQVDSGAKDNGFFYFDSSFRIDNAGTRTGIFGRQLNISSDSLPFQLPIQDSFSTLTTAGSWTNTSGTYQVPQYTQNRSSKEVVLRGEVGGGSSGSVIATLPTGYRPAKTAVFLCAATSGSGVATVSVANDGQIIHRGSSTTSISLDQIRFFV